MFIADVALRSDLGRIPRYNFLRLGIEPSKHCSVKEALVNSADSLLLRFDLPYVNKRCAAFCSLIDFLWEHHGGR